MTTVAALYVDPRGPYPRMEGVDCWDEARDARAYAGPRDGERRTPELAPTHVHCSVDPKERPN